MNKNEQVLLIDSTRGGIETTFGERNLNAITGTDELQKMAVKLQL